jgi:DNA mismatch endonuclease (patch repair protein)
MDVVDRATRSRMMSGIRGKDTKPERIVRSHLHRAGLRFRLQAKLPGKPDLVLPKYKTAVFVHGCFWHRHEECRYATMPTSNIAFWQKKFEANVQRDIRVRQELKVLGWHVEVAWSCQLNKLHLEQLTNRIRQHSNLEEKDAEV